MQESMSEQDYVAAVTRLIGRDINDEESAAVLRWRQDGLRPSVCVTKLRWAIQARERGLPDGLT